MARSAVFRSGVPESEPATWMPPVTTKSEPSSTMNDAYSCALSRSRCPPAAPWASGR